MDKNTTKKLQRKHENIRKSWEDFVKKYQKCFPKIKCDTQSEILTYQDEDSNKSNTNKYMIETRNTEMQKTFRNKLIEIYGEKCITSKFKKPLQACHIVPFSECNNFDIGNGLLMTCNMHSLFDSFDISINPKTLRVELLDIDDDNYKIYNNEQIIVPPNLVNNVKNNLNVHYKQFLNRKYCLNNKIIKV